MNSKHLHYLLIATIIILLGALVGGTYGTTKLLSTHATTLLNLKAKDQALSQQQISLVKAKKDVARYAELQKITRAIVPEDKSQAEAVRQIVKIAGENSISLASITFPASTLGATPGARPSSAAATAPTPVVTPSTGKLSQLAPAKGIPGVYSLTITVQSDKANPISYAKFTAFLAALEQNRRTAQVSTIVLTPDPDNRSLLSFTMTLNEYIKP